MNAERLASVRAAFRRFARVEAPGLASPMYAELAHGIAGDEDLLEGADVKLSISRYREGNLATETLAEASPHGWWIAWR